MDADVINTAIDEAVKPRLRSRASTARLPRRSCWPRSRISPAADSLDANIQLVYNNARLAAKTACELCSLS